MSKNGTKSKRTTDNPAVNIAVLEACGIGLIAALGAVLLKHGVALVGTFRVFLSEEWIGWLPVIGVLGGLISGALIQFLAPHAAGSGIPIVKAYLRGVSTPLDLRTAFVKLVGCIASLGSGLALGREGPTVQVSAALSSWFSGLIRTSPVHRTQLIAAGAGAGLAAAFNAPLAGALFVLEELLGNMSGLTAGNTIVACFVAAVTA
ncbi:MAG: chloride channel protein, partial [Cyanobacteria bacterium]|nr:chloride channel protein [Cyanobacteriota bacterium]